MKVTQLFEARKPDIEYIEKRNKKAGDVLERVTAQLAGGHAANATKLARRFERLDKTAKLLKERRDEVNLKLKDLGDNLFNEEDALVTRVMETAKFAMTLSASEKAEKKAPKYSVDYEKAFAELAELVPDLEEAAKKILSRYTALVPQTDTPTKLTVKPKKLEEGLMATMKSAWTKLKSWFVGWTSSYDKKLADIKSRYAV